MTAFRSHHMLASISSSWRRSYSFILLATAIIVAAADFLFYDHAIGWTAAALVAVMFLLLATRDNHFIEAVGGRVLTLALVGLLFALVEQPTWLNVTYAIVCLSGLALINTNGWENDFTRWLGRWAAWVAIGWTRLFLDNGIAVRWLIRRGFSPRLARGIAAWILPAMLTSVFVAIFAWANPIISDWLGSFFYSLRRLIATPPEGVNFTRRPFWLAFARFASMPL